MLPVIEPDGKSTGLRILLYSAVLIPASLLPAFSGISGKIYLVGALGLGFGLFIVAARLATLGLPMTSAISKLRARQLLRATIVYLPLLFALMVTNSRH